MQNTNTQNYLSAQRAIGAGILALVAAVYFFLRTHDDKSKFFHLHGQIEFLEKELPGISHREQGKIRYLKMDDNDRIFEIFVGEDTGDFSPQLNRVDDLKPGDMIDLYYDDNYLTTGKQINRLTAFIEKDGQLYFQRGNGNVIVAGILFFSGFGLIFFGIRLVKKYKNRF